MGGIEDVNATVVRLRRADALLTKRQLAAHLGRSIRWIELRVREGMPSEPPTRRFPHRRFRLADIEAWLANGQQKPSTDHERIVQLERQVATHAVTVQQLTRRAE
jgi:hypothetical protein